MDTFYYLSPPSMQKSWLDLAAAVAPLVFSFVAIVISFWVARTQRNIQERQLKKDLFDRRFTVYTDTREFLDYVNCRNGYIDRQGPECKHFKETMERAEMLFDRPGVQTYLKEINKAAWDLSTCTFTEQANNETSTDPEFINKVRDLRVLLNDTLPQQRNAVFRHELKMALSATQ